MFKLINYFVLYILTLIIFIAIDAIWLGLIAKDKYALYLGDYLASPPNWSAAALFYAVYILGLVIFASCPAIKSGRSYKAWVMGGLYGFFCYATYSFTNLATLKDWPSNMIIPDLIWGTFVSSTAAFTAILIYFRVFSSKSLERD